MSLATDCLSMDRTPRPAASAASTVSELAMKDGRSQKGMVFEEAKRDSSVPPPRLVGRERVSVRWN